MSTENFKYKFTNTGEPLKTSGSIDTYLTNHGFPGLTRGTFSTGIGFAGMSGDRLVVVRHPDRNPDKTNTNGSVVFGAPSTTAQIEVSMAIADREGAIRRARKIMHDLKSIGLEEASKRNGGVFSIGIESEFWHSENGGPSRLPEIDQIELHNNILERSSPPVVTVQQQRRQLAQILWDSHNGVNGTLNNTSVPISGSPMDHAVNDRSDSMGEYVNAIQYFMHTNYLNPVDSLSAQYMDQLAREFGFDSFASLRSAKGDLAYWTVSAAHASVGLSHFRDKEGNMSVGLEEALAIADLFNSDFATIAEFMTYSTPILDGKKISINGKSPKDVRAVMKLASQTAYPGEIIQTPEQYYANVSSSMVCGTADRMDRAAYSHNGVSSAHGRVRIRTAYTDLDNPDAMTGRIEFTGCGSTPDMNALLARNAFLQLLTIYAYEAVANGQHPAEYASKYFSSMSSSANQIELSHAFNFNGINDKKIMPLIREAYRFIYRMQTEYGQDPEIYKMCEMAKIGIYKFSHRPDSEVIGDESMLNGGLVTDTISIRNARGVPPDQLTVEVAQFERKQAFSELDE